MYLFGVKDFCVESTTGGVAVRVGGSRCRRAFADAGALLLAVTPFPVAAGQ